MSVQLQLLLWISMLKFELRRFPKLIFRLSTLEDKGQQARIFNAKYKEISREQQHWSHTLSFCLLQAWNYKIIFILENQKEMETPFIKKVKKILDDSTNTDTICWSSDKTMIEIRNQKIFEQKVLSKHFRHARISSFIRQLNLYGFKKIRTAEIRTFTHPLLQKGLGLESIVNKKKKTTKASDDKVDRESLDQKINFEKDLCEIALVSKKEIASDHRISQNLIANKQTEKEDKTQISTSNVISAPQQPNNVFWLIPIPAAQSSMWKPTFSGNQDQLNIGFNYNFFPNWY